MPLDLDAPPPPKRRRFGVTTVLVVVALFLLAEVVYEVGRDDTTRGFLGSIVETYRSDRARGLVVDAATGRSIPGASVRLTTIGWDGNPLKIFMLTPGRTILKTLTDSTGHFDLSYRDRGQTFVDIHRDGFAAIAEVPLSPGIPIFPTSRLDASTPGVDARRFTVRIGEARAFEIDFDTLGTGGEADAPDLRFERPAGPSGQLVIRALGAGGLARFASSYPAPIDPVAAQCMAPEDGYVAVDSMAMTATDVGTIWFVRRADGVRFARIRVVARALSLPAEDPRSDQLGITLWRNEEGGRQLCLPPGEIIRRVRRAKVEGVAED